MRQIASISYHPALLVRRSPTVRAFLTAIATTVAALFPVMALAVPEVVHDPSARGQAIAFHSMGRTLADAANGQWTYQWPGQQFRVRFHGASVLFVLGQGDVAADVVVDGKPVLRMVRPPAGRYRLTGLGESEHEVRLRITTEQQAGTRQFGGFFAPDGVAALPAAPAARQIEFIGDSHTVGYGARSTTRACTQDEIWETTDNALAYGSLLAQAHQADYRVHAISGRGIVRNYNGFLAPSLPLAYPGALMEPGAATAPDPHWRPALIVISLGTNDFSTPLNPGEPWVDRQALRDDYVATYHAFVQSLRQEHPHARIVLWSTDLYDGEIAGQLARVQARLQASGERLVSTVTITGLEMSGCNFHPSAADHERIAREIDQHLQGLAWQWPPTDRP
jgi:lysophospholipase L1-like esterase